MIPVSLNFLTLSAGIQVQAELFQRTAVTTELRYDFDSTAVQCALDCSGKFVKFTMI